MNPDSLIRQLKMLTVKMEASVQKMQNQIERLHPSQQMSAINLIHYLTLRTQDIRCLQDELHVFGLSSLASSESHILRQVQTILERLGKSFSPEEISRCDYDNGREIINVHSNQIFGFTKEITTPHLMITFDAEFTDNYQLIKKLLEAGMNVARINCAHDNEEVWKKMIDLVQTASRNTNLPCKIYMDLPGPKIRATILGRGRLVKKISLFEGQEISLAEQDADFDPSNIVIGCDEPDVINQLKIKERVLFDDGVIEAVITCNVEGIAKAKIVRISRKKPLLKEGKGMNFPDSKLLLPSLTPDDIKVLPFVCRYADMVGYSFVRSPQDIEELQNKFAAYSKRPIIILKIETADAVKNLPSLLMQGMKDEVFGVMIARGDLAVEIGFERLSEIQEEILWISEAAHVPVIWATQVLETLNKSGIATRSEITDAAYAAQAECVLINKGDYVINVMETLNDIMRRSGGHHAKKRYTFRPMNIALNFFKENHALITEDKKPIESSLLM